MYTGEYDNYDYEGQNNPTGVPSFMQTRSQPVPSGDTPQFKSGPGGDFGPGDGPGAIGSAGGTRPRNTSVGEM